MATPIPRNQAAFTLREILDATGGTLVSGGGGRKVRTSEVSTDTRSVGAGALFVALRGEAFDAHDHLDSAARAGAGVLVVERDVAAPAGVAVVRVRSTLDALGALGRAHARRWRALGGVRRTIAITGSAGKTTTRVATQALLETLHPGEVHATRGNLNNLVGTPMVLLGLQPSHRYAVIEIGTNRPGEIEALSRMVEPDVGVLTLVAEAHIEELGSLEGVAHEKGALYRALPPDGVAIGNGDNDFIEREIETSPAEVKVFYRTAAAVAKSGKLVGAPAAVIVSRTPEGSDRSRIVLWWPPGPMLQIVTPLLGEAGAYACAAAVSIARIGLRDTITEPLLNEAFSRVEVGGGAGRLVPVHVGSDVVLIDDSYNANPASMRASIRAAAEIAAAEKRRLVLVLGEMRELGAAAESGHDDVGRAARESGAALVIAVGKLAARFTLQLAGSAITHLHVNDAGDAAVAARERCRPGDLVLVKGSRGIGTDAVVRALSRHFGSAASGDDAARHA